MFIFKILGFIFTILGYIFKTLHDQAREVENELLYNLANLIGRDFILAVEHRISQAVKTDMSNSPAR